MQNVLNIPYIGALYPQRGHLILVTPLFNKYGCTGTYVPLNENKKLFLVLL